MAALVSFLTAHGLWAVFLVALVARIGAPVPAAPVLVFAGALAASGQLSLWAAAGVSVLANYAGEAVRFLAGRIWGYKVLRLVCRLSLSPDACVSQSEALVLRWGGPSLLAARFVTGVSMVSAPVAGALRMPWPRFTVWCLVAAGAWTALFLGVGVLFSTRVQDVLGFLEDGGLLAAAVLVLVLLGFAGWHWWRRRKLRRAMSVSRISVDELRALLQGGFDPVVIDVRSDASVQVDPRRIPGARGIELSRMQAAAPLLPRDRDIVLYCNCPNEASAAQAAIMLADVGLVHARPLAGGLDAWFAHELAAAGQDTVRLS